MEWFFFKVPIIADYIERQNLMGRDPRREREAYHYKELHGRASALSGVCPYCRQNNVTRMALKRERRRLSEVAFCCDICMAPLEGEVLYQPASFFLEGRQWDHNDDARLIQAIRERYIGQGIRLSQKSMEEFFANDANFHPMRPRFMLEEGGLAE